MKTPPARKTSQAKKGSATRVVRRRAVEVEDDDDTMVKKMVKVRDRESTGGVVTGNKRQFFRCWLLAKPDVEN